MPRIQVEGGEEDQANPTPKDKPPELPKAATGDAHYRMTIPIQHQLWHNLEITHLHFTSSVGQRAREEKNAARKPDVPFWKVLRFSTLLTPATLATNFWHTP